MFIIFAIFVFILQAFIQGLPVAILTFIIGGVFLYVMNHYDKKKYNAFKLRLDELRLKSEELSLKIEEYQKSLQKLKK